MLYTKEFVAKALRGDYSYGTSVELNALEDFVASLILVGMAVCSSIIWVLAKIPLLCDLLEMFVRNYPRGAVGFFLRGSFFKAKLRRMGKNVLLDLGVLIWNPKNLSIGDNTHIDTNVKIEAGDTVAIGSCVHVASFVLLQGRGTLTIGDYAGIASGTRVYSATNDFTDGKTDKFYEITPCVPPDKQFVRCAPVRIEKRAFVGLNSVVLPGVTIGEGAMVGACSFVNRDIPPYKVAAGIPARPIKDRPRPPTE